MGQTLPLIVTLDANIIIAYLAGESSVIKSILDWKRHGHTLFLSAVAETEVLAFSGFTLIERKNTEQLLEENFWLVPFDRPIARIAADIRHTSKIKFPDAAIAATALFHKSPIVTRNIHDFKKIPELSIIDLLFNVGSESLETLVQGNDSRVQEKTS